MGERRLVTRGIGAASLEGPYAGEITPPPTDWRSFGWDGETFQVASRPQTEIVEGRLSPERPILMVTLRGGAKRHELATDDGLRFDGPDHAGSASFLPGGCGRRLRLRGVEWRWASITLPESPALRGVPAFCDRRDPVLFGLMAEMERHLSDDALDEEYCAAAGALLAEYVGRKFAPSPCAPDPPYRLTSRQLRRIDEYIAAHLHRRVRVGALADLVDCSEGHLHRAFRMTTGETPLAYLNRRRIERAAPLVREGRLPVTRIALDVGFASPTAFARTFRKVMGAAPAAYRERSRLP